jgi:hypothetical protein
MLAMNDLLRAASSRTLSPMSSRPGSRCSSVPTGWPVLLSGTSAVGVVSVMMNLSRWGVQVAARSVCLQAMEIWPASGPRSARSGREVSARELASAAGKFASLVPEAKAEAVALNAEDRRHNR